MNNASDLMSEFVSELLDNIEFDPEDDDEEDDGEEDSDSDGEEDTDVNGFNVADFLRGLVDRYEDAAVEQFARGSAETAQCIRTVIEVSIFHTLSLSL